MKGCGKRITLNSESNYYYLCDGVKLCNGSYRLCRDCRIENE